MRLPAVLVALALVPVGTAAAYQWSEHEPWRRPSFDEPTSGVECFDRTFDASAFLKGDLHAHTNRSDGDSSPEDVIGWYRGHGYAFLALTDHNRFGDPERWASLQDASFRLISGEEISMKAGGRQVHVNALCTKRRIGGGTFASAGDALAWATKEVDAQGGVALVNHPNFDRALLASDIRLAYRASLLEVMSGHPFVFSEGVGDRPSAEALWDSALHDGATFMGVAVDDVHHLRASADPAAPPGRGWIEAFGAGNDPAAICTALRRGLLYATTGVSLRRIRVTKDSYSVWAQTPDCTISFIGDGGRSLARSTFAENGEPVSYRLRGGEGYVRAKATGPDGTLAWTPAVFVRRVRDGEAAAVLPNHSSVN